MNKIAILTGDPNGIGAEITIKALNRLDLDKDRFIIISNKEIINHYGSLDKEYEICEIPYKKAEIEAGMVTKAAGEFSFNSLKKACEIRPAAIVTAPVSKEAMHLAGHFYNGQTEVLQHYLAHDGQSAEMLFIANNFRVVLLTRHCALKDINLTKDVVKSKIFKIASDFKRQLGIPNPKFALCGFNPHAGENGIIGVEERDILIPAVEELKQNGINITYPLPADTLFVQAAKHYFNNEKDDYDCYIANYHDQGLIPVKTIAGMGTVNMTIGLDIIRTSPGHGTAFDIAGCNKADSTGMIAAIKAAL